LITNRCLWTPAKNAKNLLVGLCWRAHRNMHVDMESKEIRRGRWKGLFGRMVQQGLFDQRIDQQPTDLECVMLMGGERGRRLQFAQQEDVKGNNLKLTKQQNLKWNETIAVDKEMGLERSMKPRIITVLHAIRHARMLPSARGLADALHRCFDGTPLDLDGVVVHIYFAAGYSQARLDAVGADMAAGNTVVCVAGDDTGMAWGSLQIKGCDTRFGESDLSSFEVTQDEGPLYDGLPQWMGAMGVSDLVLDEVHDAVAGGYTVREGHMKVSGDTGVMLPTGIAFTTTINSVNAIALVCEIIQNRETHTVEETARSLGLTVKYQERFTLDTVTFLKGWWCEAGDRRVWMPLPSAVLKLGKTLREPHEIMRLPKTRKHLAVRQMAYALSQGYGQVPDDYPILGVFLQTLRRLGVKPGTNKRFELHEANRDKVQITDGKCSRLSVLGAMMLRYHLDPGDIGEAETILRQINSLPAYIEHPVFDALCETDYG